MADTPEPELTRLYNGSTQPRVLGGQWGEGAIMPGESFLTDNPESYAPDAPNSPWTRDEETSALLAAQTATAGDSSQAAADGHSEPQDAPQTAVEQAPALLPNGLQDTHVLAGAQTPPGSAEPSVHVEADGDVVTDAGQVIGHVDQPAPEGAPNTGGNA